MKVLNLEDLKKVSGSGTGGGIIVLQIPSASIKSGGGSTVPPPPVSIHQCH
ncbi:hypothetical protein [Pseudoalteromonas denitrificans]|jgi:hypothetical protein|uniref:Uncharacterized protein n=1 Tax=Pseudoalteromonas denitrificans DSM 6059 TaxID=1123010 RepID=A0A1I1L6B5_9GAMM|nr:hypothetical protein [Pseudoalteromonas denitrificans]SFC65953.1 hypothetical protein SAMN02745724_02220 [Pseudoalteromonas denitrificans DSM 6059]